MTMSVILNLLSDYKVVVCIKTV